jgi:hypothetical protein
MPRGWEDSEDGPTCLACVRKAGRAAPADESPDSKLERARAASREALAQKRKVLNARIRAALLALDDPNGGEAVERVKGEVGCGRERIREVRAEMGRAGEIALRDTHEKTDAERREVLDVIGRLGEARTADVLSAMGRLDDRSVYIRVKALVRRGEIVWRQDPNGRKGARLYRVADSTAATGTSA